MPKWIAVQLSICVWLLAMLPSNCTGQTNIVSRAKSANMPGIPTVGYRTTTIYLADTPSTIQSSLFHRQLIEMIVEARKKGKLDIYLPKDSLFTSPLTTEQFEEIIAPIPEKMSAADSEAGLVRFNHCFGTPINEQLRVTKYRIHQKYTFDKLSGTMQLTPVEVELLRDIYNSDGVLRGRIPLFWLKYEHMKSIIAEYEQFNPDANFNLEIWNSYFH